jgi:hypothetical protein
MTFLGRTEMNEPIPFLGWLSDVEDTEDMLREQIRSQQKRIEQLEQLVTDLTKDKDFQ